MCLLFLLLPLLVVAKHDVRQGPERLSHLGLGCFQVPPSIHMRGLQLLLLYASEHPPPPHTHTHTSTCARTGGRAGAHTKVGCTLVKARLVRVSSARVSRVKRPCVACQAPVCQVSSARVSRVKRPCVKPLCPSMAILPCAQWRRQHGNTRRAAVAGQG